MEPPSINSFPSVILHFYEAGAGAAAVVVVVDGVVAIVDVDEGVVVAVLSDVVAVTSYHGDPNF